MLASTLARAEKTRAQQKYYMLTDVAHIYVDALATGCYMFDGCCIYVVGSYIYVD